MVAKLYSSKDNILSICLMPSAFPCQTSQSKTVEKVQKEQSISMSSITRNQIWSLLPQKIQEIAALTITAIYRTFSGKIWLLWVGSHRIKLFIRVREARSSNKRTKPIKTEDGQLDWKPNKYSHGLSLPMYRIKVKTSINGDSNDYWFINFELFCLYS